jgi:hypothetical protein
MNMDNVDVYPVGWLSAIQRSARGVRLGIRRPLAPMRQELRYTIRQARRGNWRAVRNTFNGYLAEPIILPINLHRVGSGWTKQRALRSLAHEIGAIEADLP